MRAGCVLAPGRVPQAKTAGLSQGTTSLRERGDSSPPHGPTSPVDPQYQSTWAQTSGEIQGTSSLGRMLTMARCELAGIRTVLLTEESKHHGKEQEPSRVPMCITLQQTP